MAPFRRVHVFTAIESISSLSPMRLVGSLQGGIWRG